MSAITKFRLKTVLPKVAEKYKTTSPAELSKAILQEYNKEVSSDAIRKTFSRHPEVLEECKGLINIEDAKHDNIRYDDLFWFDNKTKTSKIPIIQKWIDVMIFRKVQDKSLAMRIRTIQAICEGRRGRGKKAIQIKDWKIHPMAINEDRAVEWLVEINKRGFNDGGYRNILRNFLIFAKGEMPTKISGEVTVGKMAKEYFRDPEVEKIEHALDSKPKYADGVLRATVDFMHFTCTRATATCNVKGKDFERMTVNEREWLQVTVIDKGKIGKKERKKIIMPILQKKLEKYGFKPRMFPYTPEELRTALKTLYKEAGITREIKQPVHIWRHTGAMYWLRRTGFNYTLVCAIGGWKSENILKICYGTPEIKDLLKLATTINGVH